MNGVYATLPELVALRSRASQLSLFQSDLSRHGRRGNLRSAFKGRGMDFEEVRAYQFGDDVRTIDWRVTARRMTPHTKVFREERERPVMVILDQRHSLFFGSSLQLKSVTAVEASALVAWATLQHGDRVGGILFNEHETLELKPKRTISALLHWLNQTVRMNQQLKAEAVSPLAAADGFAAAISRARQVAHPGTQIVLISDFQHLNDDTVRHLTALAKHCELLALRISDPLEHHLPQGNYQVTDGLQRLRFQGRSQRLQQQFAHEFHQHQQALDKLFMRLRIAHIPLSAAQPTVEQLVAGGRR